MSAIHEVRNSYERTLIARCHKLTRIAAHVLTFIVDNELMDSVLDSISDPFHRQELEKWWEQYQIDDATAKEKREKAAVRARKRAAALAKLTPSERKLLHIKEIPE
jgi:hypothetical protein